MQTEPITIERIAKMCGVSKGTVSRTLTRPEMVAPKTRERILQAMRDTNYVPNPAARAMNYPRADTISIIAPDIRFSFQCELIKNCQQALYRSGYNLAVLDSSLYQARTPDYTDMLMRQVTMGTIFCYENSTESMDALGAVQPVVSYELEAPGVHSVTTDVEAGMKLMLEYLSIAKGHRQIALVLGREGDAYSQRMLTAFENGMTALGLSIPKEYLQCSQWSMQHGAEAMELLLSLPQPPTAVMYYSCTMAQGGLMACCRRGVSVPGDISVVTLDGAETNAYLAPGISTVDLNVHEIGETLAALMLSVISDRSIPVQRRTIAPAGLRTGYSVKNLRE